MRIGLVGLPRSGKTSVFNLLTGAHAETAFHGGGHAPLHAGRVHVPDERVDHLAAFFRPGKVTYAAFEVVDVAGVSQGHHEALEVKEIRAADALLHVVRAFPDAAGTPADPRRDIADLEAELVLADLEVVERRLERLEAQIRKKRVEADLKEQALLRALKPAIEGGRPVRALALSEEDARGLRGFSFLSQKPILHCLNLAEKEVERARSLAESFGLGEVARQPATRLGWVSAVIEAEVAELGKEEQAAFLADLGLPEPAIRRLIRDCYALLGLVSFFTTDGDEVRAWSIPAGTRAQDAAGAVHSDMARGFIRVEVVAYADLLAAGGSPAQARERGKLQLHGKDYLVQDGDVCHFRFHVAK